MTPVDLPELAASINGKLLDGVRINPLENVPSFSSNPRQLINLCMRNGDSYLFEVEIKHIHRKESLSALLKSRASQNEYPILLLCNPLTPALIEFCAVKGINFIDRAGNARIHIAGLHFVVGGMKDEKKPTDAYRIQQKISEGTLKLLFVLLIKPDSINLPYRSLASMAGISLGMVSKAFEYLKNHREYRDGKSGRRLTDSEKLMTMWLQEYATVLKPKLKSIRLEEPNDWTAVQLNSGEVWGGEAAAYLLSEGYLTPENLQLFTFDPLPQRLMELGSKKSDHGQLWLTQAFWGKSFELTLIGQAMLCIAELVASNDDRNIETARMINDKYLKLKDTAVRRY